MKASKIKAFEFATDTTKQLITLSTVLIGISVTFFEKFDVDVSKWFLIGSWLLFLISIVAGILTLMSITGVLDKYIDTDDDLTPEQSKDGNTNNKTASIYHEAITNKYAIQIFLFIGGLSLLIYYSSNVQLKTDEQNGKAIQIIEKRSYQLVNPNVIDTLEATELSN